MKKRPFLLLLLPILASCQIDFLTDGFSYLSANAVPIRLGESPVTYYTFFDQTDAGGKNCLPPTGKSNVLVLPVEIDGYPFLDSIIDDLEAVYNGTSATLGYPSVSEFYSVSSYGRKELDFEIAPVYELGLDLKESFEEAGRERLSNFVLSRALPFYAKSHDLSSFDLDEDGYIDAIAIVYSAPDYQSHDYGSSFPSDDASELWAYTYYASSSSLSSPSPRAHSWISSSFLYKGANLLLDPHTFIHETGHLFGLEDYYSYDQSDASVPSSDPEKYRSPLGMLDMMDYGLLDHNAWSKFALGWIEPWHVDESCFRLGEEITVELKDLETSGEAIVIPARGSDYKGHAFDEFMMIELFAPVGLNSFDAGKSYQAGYPKGYTMPGLRIYHVDARMVGKGNYSGVSSDPADIAWGHLDNPINGHFDVAASNTASRSEAPSRAPLISLIEAEGKNTLKNENYESTGRLFGADNRALFYPDANHAHFSMDDFAPFFANIDPSGKALMNDGSEWGYSIRVNGIKKSGDGYSASITISLD